MKTKIILVASVLFFFLTSIAFAGEPDKTDDTKKTTKTGNNQKAKTESNQKAKTEKKETKKSKSVTSAFILISDNTDY